MNSLPWSTRIEADSPTRYRPAPALRSRPAHGTGIAERPPAKTGCRYRPPSGCAASVLSPQPTATRPATCRCCGPISARRRSNPTSPRPNSRSARPSRAAPPRVGAGGVPLDQGRRLLRPQRHDPVTRGVRTDRPGGKPVRQAAADGRQCRRQQREQLALGLRPPMAAAIRSRRG